MEEAPPPRLPERGQRVPHPVHPRATVFLTGSLVGPVHHQRAPFDLVDGQEAPVAAVLAVVAIVAQDEQLARGNHFRPVIVAAALDAEPELRVTGTQRRLQEMDVRLLEWLSLDVDGPPAGSHPLTRQAHSPPSR